jgi:hypothetical protein
MTCDPLFDAMRHFAYEDVHRAKAEKQSKTAWTQHLTEGGREMADRLGVAISDFEIERKAQHVARYTWANFKTVADMRREQRKAEREMLARAKRKPPKTETDQIQGQQLGLEEAHRAKPCRRRFGPVAAFQIDNRRTFMTDTGKGPGCLHCELNRLIDDHNERQHLETGRPANVDDNIDDLVACTAELIAFYGDAKVRRSVAKRTAELLVKRVRLFRSEGRYPGGEGSAVHETHTLQ